MAFGYTYQRTWLNLKRHRITIFLSILVLAGITILMGLIYPGPQAVLDFMQIRTFQLFIGILNIESSK